MKISKELIGKYHDGKCTPQEMAMVENWLLSEDIEPEIVLPDNVNKETLKAEMWIAVASVLPSASRSVQIRKPVFLQTQWVGAAAAVLILVSAFLFVKINGSISAADAIVSSVNSSELLNTEISEDDYTISLGPMSNVQINSSTGFVDFCGTLLISPKKDMKLSFKDICSNKNAGTGKINIKKGETYIALNYRHKKTNEVIVLDEKFMMGLPPVVKRQLMDQFNI